MQYASANPNVTCIRAKMLFASAKSALAKAKTNLKHAKETGTGVNAAEEQLNIAESVYERALTLVKKVTVAKTETRMALKKFYVIEHKAKDAE